MEEGRGGLLSAGGILSIIVGAFEVIGGAVMLLLATGMCTPFGILPLRFCAGPGPGHGMWAMPVWWMVMGGVLVVLGILAIAGGISAVRRKSFGLSLLGAICALVPLNLLGLLAVIFVSLGKREF